ncbi:actin-related protein 2/3 complex subunit 2A [Selaginella moellendorffii]|uniref:actin-related protein 2/3 complex subunit 2A n=1 Tax=Selaginella moellendorffii TaxID=88036 RepID=UPI000D1CDDF2|nr:actin-related protein 2/3 complex subunit 2A [Selaginella moellendorffii]|eukprot:XP_024534606.1 actin-related protein 2/3 complex subunit 2A [Selaginella moellendorffii]
MILMQPQARAVLQILVNRSRVISSKQEKPLEIDFHLVEFNDVRYHILSVAKEPHYMTLSLGLPLPAPETVFSGDLPLGAVEAVRGAYGSLAQVKEPPEMGYNLTLRIDLSQLPADEEDCLQVLTKFASVRSVVLGAPLREILKHLAMNTVSPDADRLTALMHRPRESCFLVPQADKVTVIFPMRFKDANDAVLATSFLQEFMEARRTGGLNTAPPCLWSSNPPAELQGVSGLALDANCGFVSIVIFARHVEGDKLERTVWNLSTFHAYVSYHVKCSKAFMHTRMRRRVESLIQVLNRAKPDLEKDKKTAQGRSFKRSV